MLPFNHSVIMKKTLTLFFGLVTVIGNAQDFSTFGLAANPGNPLRKGQQTAGSISVRVQGRA